MKKQTEHICKRCGALFMARSDAPTMYCSKECRYAVKKPPKMFQRKCFYCGKEFESLNSEKKYCSSECQSKNYLNKRISICLACGHQFEKKKAKQKYCSPQCGSAARNTKIIVKCAQCKKELKKTPALAKRYKHHFCCKAHYDEWLKLNHEKRGVLIKNGVYHHGGKDGYIFLYQNSKHYRGEHRLVMEDHLGRPLRSDEIVHHKDGNKQNNDISNLEIVTRAEHINIHREQLQAARGILSKGGAG